MKNQMTNFQMTSGYPKHQNYMTSYNTITGQANHWTAKRMTIGEVQAKKTSIQLGKGNKCGFVTMNQRLFAENDVNHVQHPPSK